MKLPIALCAAVLAGCSRSTLRVLVPTLDLSVRLARSHEANSHGDHSRVLFGAWLRWHPLHTDAAAGSAMTAAEAITPCEVDDESCLTEYTEAEPEVAAVRLGAP